MINLEKIKPSFEEIDNINETQVKINKLKNKKRKLIDNSQAVLIGLDKITAKSSKISVKLNEVKKIRST